MILEKFTCLYNKPKYMTDIISCPICLEPIKVYPPDTTRTKCSIRQVNNSWTQFITCPNSECGVPFKLYWYQ
jgi:hypothetical protein